MSWSERWRTLRTEARKQSAAALSQAVSASGQLGKLMRGDGGEHEARAPARRTGSGQNRARNVARSGETGGTTRAGAAPLGGAAPPGSLAAGGLRVIEARPPATTPGLAAARRDPSATVADGVFAALAPDLAARGAAAAREYRAGDVLADRYEVRRVVGASALYRVYAARHRAWGVDVAIKVPRTDSAAPPARWRALPARVRRWIALAAHPHVASCHYLDCQDGVPLLVLEYRGGGDLRAGMASGATADARVALDLAVQICHGLERAHAAGLWHGGLRPENLLFDSAGTLAIGDFGLSVALTAGGAGADAAASGFAPYVAPEQWADASAIDVRTDVFALGVCLWELLTGSRPEVMARGALGAAAEDQAADGALPSRLVAILRRCIAWDPADRPASVAAVREALCAAYCERFGTASPSAQLPKRCWDAEGWNDHGVALAFLGCEREAEAAWERALAADAAHLEATYNRAAAEWQRGGITDAAVLERVTRAAARQPDTVAVAPVVAAVHLARGDSDAAVAQLEKAGRTGELDEEGAALLASARRHRPAAADRWSGHRAYVSAVQIAGDQQALSASDDGTLALWQPGEPAPRRVLEGHAGAVTAVAASAGGTRALSGGDDATLRLWDVHSGECLKVFSAPGKVLSVALGAEATRALVACCDADNFLGIDNTTLIAVDLDKDRLLARLEGHTSAVKCVALSADGRLGASGSDDFTVRLWDLAHAGHCRRVLAGHTHFVSAVGLSADGALAVSGGWDTTLRVWDTNSGRCLRVLNGHAAPVSAVALSADGSLLVSGGLDHTVRVWEVGTGRCLRTFAAHAANVSGVAVSADGTLAVSGGWDRSVHLWRVPSREEVTLRPRRSRPAR